MSLSKISAHKISSSANMEGKVCLNAIEMNRTFAGLHSILFRTRLLALNAQIACARAGSGASAIAVMVQELITMGAALSDLVKGVEVVFENNALHAATWLRANQRIKILEDTLRRFPSAALVSKEPNPSEKNEKEDSPSTPPSEFLSTSFGRINRLSNYIGNDAESTILGFRTVPARLARLLERLNLVATRQSNFLATTVAIETSRLSSEHTHLANVADDIRCLANDISGLERHASDSVRVFSSLVSFALRC